MAPKKKIPIIPIISFLLLIILVAFGGFFLYWKIDEEYVNPIQNLEGVNNLQSSGDGNELAAYAALSKLIGTSSS